MMLLCVTVMQNSNIDVALFLRLVGERVARARSERGISRAQLAARTGLSLPTVVGLELGEFGVEVDDLHLVADALGLPTPALLPDERELQRSDARPTPPVS
jgi:transcriptional regulator with XRE-family HTH domain